MTDDNETCHRCGEQSNLRTADQNGVFRPVCQDCFEEHHSGPSRPNWNDWSFLGGVTGALFMLDLAGMVSTVSAISAVIIVMVGWLVVTTVSGLYPWSMR